MPELASQTLARTFQCNPPFQESTLTGQAIVPFIATIFLKIKSEALNKMRWARLRWRGHWYYPLRGGSQELFLGDLGFLKCIIGFCRTCPGFLHMPELVIQTLVCAFRCNPPFQEALWHDMHGLKKTLPSLKKIPCRFSSHCFFLPIIVFLEWWVRKKCYFCFFSPLFCAILKKPALLKYPAVSPPTVLPSSLKTRELENTKKKWKHWIPWRWFLYVYYIYTAFEEIPPSEFSRSQPKRRNWHKLRPWRLNQRQEWRRRWRCGWMDDMYHRENGGGPFGIYTFPDLPGWNRDLHCELPDIKPSIDS